MDGANGTTWHSDRAELHCGDCLPVLRGMADASVEAVVTDPPAGIGFMGKTWDANKGGRDQWIDWLHSVMVECLRILKPGGHALVWAIPRTSHWTATACEDAGFEIRDRVSHLFGSGFPKSMDASKAIDKAAGAERPDAIKGGHRGMVGKGGDDAYSEGHRAIKRAVPPQVGMGKLTRGTPVTDSAAQWSGWGTALKPAMEDWWLCRKPLAGTVAENLQQHGTGALNVDACRVEARSRPLRDARVGNDSAGVYGDGLNGSRAIGETNLGRWPAHLTHDGSEEVLSRFPQTQSGKAAEGGHVRNSDKHRNSFQPFAGQRCEGDVLYGDSGSAARFFFQAQWSDNEWLNNLSSVTTAGTTSCPRRERDASALVRAVSAALPEGLLCYLHSPEPFTNATASESRRCVEAAIATTQSIAERCWLGLPLESDILNHGPAKCAVSRTPTGTTTITVSHWKFDGSADPVTFSITPRNSEHGAKDSQSSRFLYCPKASRSDRGAANKHPTVKPTALMRWLCRLITPPGGIIVDPFMGSGSTGKAAILEGFRFVGMEREREYFAEACNRIGKAERIAARKKQRDLFES